eukprot:CAMPEP_0198109592 /NCGR_PEP_ID=MMETSP1442-20131203/1664_1 /TAXON_ID= /ORGANISM="Craspedostauros australis, Strain CCMP3328" /LENGTH=503 /DNA_ID=CAMNT_0043765331 /DNA_START=66 /DNA_END=1577 /DNA_ORIENTATION=-
MAKKEQKRTAKAPKAPKAITNFALTIAAVVALVCTMLVVDQKTLPEFLISQSTDPRVAVNGSGTDEEASPTAIVAEDTPNTNHSAPIAGNESPVSTEPAAAAINGSNIPPPIPAIANDTNQPPPQRPVRTQRMRRQSCFAPHFDVPQVVTYDPAYVFEMKVPFYVYEDQLSMADMTSCGVPLGMTNYAFFKHSDDYWMLQSALVHPMRTKNATEAKLFFVPFLMNALADGIAWRNRYLCIHDGMTCFDHTVTPNVEISWADMMLGRSEYFRRFNGADHVVVTSHYAASRAYRRFGHFTNIMSTNRVIYQNFPQRWPDSTLPPRITMQNLYVANQGCQAVPPNEKTADFALIASMKPNDRNFDDRAHICQWIADANYSNTNCGAGKMCPALANARFGFHARGDDYGSNRPFDIVASETVPVFTHEEQFRILPDFARFREMSYLVNVSSAEAFHDTIRPLLELTLEAYTAKLAIVKANARRVDITTGEPFDIYMAEFARKLRFQD